MVTAAAGEDFSKWLNEKLRKLNTDETVFGAYITGILEGDETIEEKQEALQDIISQIVVSYILIFICLSSSLLNQQFISNIQELDIDAILKEILDKWEQFRPSANEPEQKAAFIDIDTKLAQLLESKAITATVHRQKCTPEEQRIREQILAQYSQVELDECEDDDVGTVGGGGGSAGPATEKDPIMEKNTNALDVAQLVKERREQAKVDSKAKKDKDKEDR